MTAIPVVQDPEQRDGLSGIPALQKLNPQRREVVMLYLLGPEGIRGVQYRAYLAAGYSAKDKNVASAAAYQVFHHPNVQAAIAEVQREIDKQFMIRLGSWMAPAVRAKELLEGYLETLAGERVPVDQPPGGDKVSDQPPPIWLNANALSAIREVLDRAVGRPTQKTETDIGQRMDRLIRELAEKRRSPALPHGGNGNGDGGMVEVHAISAPDRRDPGAV